MTRPDFLRTEYSERRPAVRARHSVSERLEIFENGPEASVDVPWDVLEKAPAGIDFGDELLESGPEVPRVLGAESFAGLAEGLAGVASNETIHETTPRSASEGV